MQLERSGRGFEGAQREEAPHFWHLQYPEIRSGGRDVEIVRHKGRK